MTTPLNESTINIIAVGSRLEGKIVFENISRVHGTLVGQIEAKDGSTLILGESGMIEGTVHADTLMIDGFIQGNIHARTKVTISGTGRVLGNIKTPSLTIGFGAFFEGECLMEKLVAPSAPGSAPVPLPVG